MRNKKIIIIGLAIIVIAIVLILGIFFAISKSKNKIEEEQPIDTEKLEENFSSIFNNAENDYVVQLYDISETKSGAYKIDAKIPYIHGLGKASSQINKEINEVFINKILQVYNETQNYTIVSMDYATSCNGDILSLAIRFKLKEGPNAQRQIIKTYNYNIKENKQVSIEDLISETDKEKVQAKIFEKVEKEIKREDTIINQGHKVYRRDKDSDIYVLKNASEFYVEGNILYIIYSYGNSSYTGEIDVIATDIQ